MNNPYYVIFNHDQDLIDELRQRGIGVYRIWLGDLGYTTDYQIEYLCESINEIMADEQDDWKPIIWDELPLEVQTKLMLMAADSDTFVEKARLPRHYGYEHKIRQILTDNQ